MSGQNQLYSIGEFSRITGLTIKALRFYHAENLLPPAVIDADSSYRYYTPDQVELARAIRLLRDLDLPLPDIRAILAARDSHERVQDLLARHKVVVQDRIRHQNKVLRQLEQYLSLERHAVMTESPQAQEKQLPPTLVAGIRMKGKYSDCGKAFGPLYRAARSAAGGHPMLLHYDTEYKEDDADFEACIPLKRPCTIPTASVHELPAARAVVLLHKGPYETLGPSYQRIFEYIKSLNLRALTPSREIYLKGPGMIFRGNPKKYLTEIQVLVES